MPNSPSLWIAAGTLWILDASINVSMEPFRALVGDVLPPEQRGFGYALQSFFIGIGAVVASALPWMMTNWFDVSNTAEAGAIPESVKLSFYAGGLIFLAAVSWTVFALMSTPLRRWRLSSMNRRTTILKPVPVTHPISRL